MSNMYSVRYVHGPSPFFSFIKVGLVYMHSIDGRRFDEPMYTFYALTWNGLHRKLSRWMKDHKNDIPIDWYIDS